jgi:micrococcal nuclease
MKKYIFYSYAVFLYVLLSGWPSFAHEWFSVKWVNDGDTIVLADGRNVRYIGINAPEIDHGSQKAEPYGYKAKNYNKKMVLSTMIRLEIDKERYDQYGRLLAYIFLKDGKFVNKAMIEQGYAYLLPRRPNVRYNKVLLQSQRNAMSAKHGIWRNWKEKESGYLGSRRSKRFHYKTCPFGKRIGKTNKIFFSSKWDAFWAGFAPCKRCMSDGK